jgi:hypothetical protein
VTLLPSDSWQIEGVDGDTYQVGPACEAPGCKRWVDHQHHLWRRSFLGRPKREKDYRWVKLPDGQVIRNVIALCWRHHEEVTGGPGGHLVWIKWIPGTAQFEWLQRSSLDSEWEQVGTLSLPAPPDQVVPDGSGREAERRCPTCGRAQRKPEPERKPGPKRPRKSWTIKVPADHEDGAAILDELVEGCAEVFGMDEYTSKLRRYYVVERALVVVLQNRALIETEVG